MNDDQMDELLAEAGRDYNEPGDVPREAMWGRIAQARRQQNGLVAGRHRRVRAWTGAGIAAALLIATGIGIGRRMERSPLGGGAVAARDTGGRRDSAASVAPQPRVAVGTTDSIVREIRATAHETDDRVRRMAGATVDSGASVAPSSDQALAYRLVVLQHLAGTEAMITSFRTSARSGEIDAQMGKWARELLGTTRLLEASPAADDPVMKRLLEDLELVIVQIVQYAGRGTNDPEELDLIEQSIKKRGVITKLRGTLPGQSGLTGTRG
jgi:hypothetical protein